MTSNASTLKSAQTLRYVSYWLWPDFFRAGVLYIGAHAVTCAVGLYVRTNTPPCEKEKYAHALHLLTLLYHPCDQATWTLVVEDEDAPLPELNFVCTEIRPRWPLSSPHAASGDGDEVGTPQQTHAPREENALASGPELEKALRLHLWGTCVSMYERFVVCVRGVEYVARVTEVGVRDAEESVADYLIPGGYGLVMRDPLGLLLLDLSPDIVTKKPIVSPAGCEFPPCAVLCWRKAQGRKHRTQAVRYQKHARLFSGRLLLRAPNRRAMRSAHHCPPYTRTLCADAYQGIFDDATQIYLTQVCYIIYILVGCNCWPHTAFVCTMSSHLMIPHMYMLVLALPHDFIS